MSNLSQAAAMVYLAKVNPNKYKLDNYMGNYHFYEKKIHRIANYKYWHLMCSVNIMDGNKTAGRPVRNEEIY